MKLIGTVTSGTGDAAGFMRKEGYFEQFEQKLGYAPFPGTLNIKVGPEQLSSVAALKDGPVILIEPFEEGGQEFGMVTAYPAVLKGQKVAILFPERSRYGPEMLEIISPDNLRKKLGLKDGDKVEIVVE